MTLYAHGSPLLLDTGQWRYTYGTTRSFVVSRAAHNVVARPRRAAHQAAARAAHHPGRRAGPRDRRRPRLPRRHPDPHGRLRPGRGRPARLGPARLRPAGPGQPAVGPRPGPRGPARRRRGAHLRVRVPTSRCSSPPVAPRSTWPRAGSKPMRGWNSQAYGELSPAPSVRATQKGTSLSWLTVLTPRAEGVAASTVSATAVGQRHAARRCCSARAERLRDGQPRRRQRLADRAHRPSRRPRTHRGHRAGGHARPRSAAPAWCRPRPVTLEACRSAPRPGRRSPPARASAAGTVELSHRGALDRRLPGRLGQRRRRPRSG